MEAARVAECRQGWMPGDRDRGHMKVVVADGRISGCGSRWISAGRQSVNFLLYVYLIRHSISGTAHEQCGTALSAS